MYYARAAQIIDFQVISEDYSKMVFACADRSLTFHAKFGGYCSIRLPKTPRSVAYHAPSADIIAVGSSNEVYRRARTPAIGRLLAAAACFADVDNTCSPG